ncbi:hypothetical protein EMCRGX_G014385 [Ephydatia muelleri]
MGVNDPVEAARTAFITSRAYTDVIVTAIKDKGDFSVYDHLQQMTQAKKEMNHEIKGFQEDSLTSILTSQSEGKKRAIQRVVKGKTSTWLTVLPVSHYHSHHQNFVILWLLDIANHYQSCLLTVMDVVQSLPFSMLWTAEKVRDADPVRGLPALVADLGVRGLWAAQTEALFDIRVMDTDAQSYISRTVDSVLLSAENEKKYLDALLATKIALKWEKPLSEVTGWVRATLAFAILRATNLCIRGSRVKWRSAVHMDDGAGLPTNGGVQFTWKMVLDYPQMEECSSHG